MTEQEMLELLVKNGIATKDGDNVQHIKGLAHVDPEELKPVETTAWTVSRFENGENFKIYRVAGIQSPEVCYVIPVITGPSCWWSIRWELSGRHIVLANQTFQDHDEAVKQFRLIRAAIQAVLPESIGESEL